MLLLTPACWSTCLCALRPENSDDIERWLQIAVFFALLLLGKAPGL